MEYDRMEFKAENYHRMQRVAEEKEQKLTEVGLILHEILGTKNPPTRVIGIDCVELAKRVQKRVGNNILGDD